jgi:hypothetical protein
MAEDEPKHSRLRVIQGGETPDRGSDPKTGVRVWHCKICEHVDGVPNPLAIEVCCPIIDNNKIVKDAPALICLGCYVREKRITEVY